jgi:VanZ family protein
MIEVIQPSFGRSANISDFLADIVGVVMGILIGRVARRLLLSP